MLFLMRRPGESIHIADDTKVTVLIVDENEVTLGVTSTKKVTTETTSNTELKHTYAKKPHKLSENHEM